MIEYPYGQLPDAYVNVKEAAKEPWRGITAWVQGNPFLIINKTDDTYVLEGENGEVFVTDRIGRWESATERSSLVAASRLENSPFARGNRVGSFTVGDLLYFENEWHVRTGHNNDFSFPLERLVESFDAVRWNKNADLLPATGDMHCPECGSDDIQPDDSYDHGIWQCHNCGKQGYAEEFESEEPDYDPTHDHDQGFYEDWTGSKVAEFDGGTDYDNADAGGLNSFEYNLPPAGIHFRTHAAMQAAGLNARVHYPPGLSSNYPDGFTSNVPGNTAMDDMALPIDYEMEQGGNPEDIRVKVETPHDPEQVRQLFDKLGGRKAGKTAETDGDDIGELSGPTQEAITCPKCGSHSIRAFSPSGTTATLVCLTCGNEFERDVHINPEASVKEAVTPIDPNTSAQILGLMQQIEQAYQQNDTARAQQLHQQMMQLMNNPNVPLQNTPVASVEKDSYGGPVYPPDQNSQSEIRSLMDQITAAAEQHNMTALYQLRIQLEQLLGGNPNQLHASMDKGSPYPSDSYKNAPDHTPKGQKSWPKEVNAIYNACMREGNGSGDTKEERESSCAAIAWAQHNKGKKKSFVNNDELEDSTQNFFLESLTFEGAAWDDDLNYGQGQPEQLDPYVDDDTDDRDIDYAHCPACDGPGVLLGELGGRIHYRCRNCGTDFSHAQDTPQSVGPERTEPFGSGGTQYHPMASYDDAKEVNQNTLKAFKDSSGNPIEAGKFYTLHHPSYKVPDVVQILNLEDGRIEAAISSDEHGAFPIHITHDEAFSLDPYEQKTASGWSVVARRNFTADEQKELIDENPDGKARNFDKLNLEGTHYQIKEESSNPDFLLGW